MGQSRSTQRLPMPIPPPADEALVTWLRSFALEHPRWGYKRAHSEANKQGWSVDRKRIQRLWRNAGLNEPPTEKEKTHPRQRSSYGSTPANSDKCLLGDGLLLRPESITLWAASTLNSSVNFLLLIAIVTSLQPTSYVGNLSVYFPWGTHPWV